MASSRGARLQGGRSSGQEGQLETRSSHYLTFFVSKTSDIKEYRSDTPETGLDLQEAKEIEMKELSAALQTKNLQYNPSLHFSEWNNMSLTKVNVACEKS